MWATFFTLLSIAAIYNVIALLGISWEVAIGVFFAYMMYLPPQCDSVRRWRLFEWLRGPQCSLSYTGNVDLLKEAKGRIFVFHPHGVHCAGAVLLGSDPAMAHVRIACTYFLFWVPVAKEFVAWSGCINCTDFNIKKALKAESPVVLYPGGISEIPGADHLREPAFKKQPSETDAHYVYTRRKGFVRLAMEQGCEIVPCWVHGEVDLYDVVHPFPSIGKKCYEWFRYPWPVVSWGWRWVPFLPKKQTVTIEVGKPIATRLDGDLDAYHADYKAELARLSAPYIKT